MVLSITQARSLITQRRQQISQQRKELDTAKRNIEQTRLASLTRAELQVRGREEILARKRQASQLESLKKTQIKQLNPFEKELTSVRGDVDKFEKQVVGVEQQIKKQEETIRAFEKAKRVFQSDDPRAIFAIKTSEEKKFLKIFQADRQAEIRKQIKKDEEKIKLDIQKQFVLPEKEITKFEQLKIIAQEALLGKTGQQFVGVNIIPSPLKGKFGTFLSKPDVPATKIRETLRKGGLAGKVIAEFVPTTPAGALAFISIGGVATAGIPVVSKGVIRGIQALGALTALDTKQAPETRIAGTIIAIAPFIPALKQPKKGKTGIILLPSGKRGQARFSELEEFFKKQKKKALDLDKVLNELQFKQVGKTFREKTKGEKVADLRKIINKIKKTKDKKLQQEQLRGTLKLLEQTFGKAEARSIFKDFLEQEGLVLTPKQAPVKQFTKFVAKPKPTIAPPVEAPAIQLGENLFFLTEQQIKEREKQVQPLAFVSAQPITQVQPELEALTKAQKTRQRQEAKKRTLLLTALRVTQAQRARPRVKAKPRLKKPIPLLKIPKLPKGVTNTKLVKAIQKLGKEGVDILVGMKLEKQKIIGKNLPPFKALKKGLKFVDDNIEASFRLRKTKKTAKGKDIEAFNIGRKFRPSKKNILFLVEKRKFRLDSPREVSQLKSFKGKIPKGFFPKVKKKKRK